MNQKTQKKARERRNDKRIINVGMGKKSVSDGLIEEATEEAFDWLERGGLKRIWEVLKLLALILAVLIATALYYILN